MRILKKVLCLLLAVLLVCTLCACIGSSSSSRRGSSSNKGFVGSDGVYHSYIPEFGNDVNSWMAENW